MEVTNAMKIEKFDGRNFKQWKFQIKCALRAQGLKHPLQVCNVAVASEHPLQVCNVDEESV